MGRITPLLVSAILLLSSSIVYGASAQTVLPDVELECQQEAFIEVYPGSTQTGFYFCTVRNPTAYSEEVEIQISSDVLQSSGPQTMSLGPNAETDIVINLRGEQGMDAQSISVETQAVVVSANGIDVTALPEASDTADTTARILQYSAPTIQLTEAEITIASGQNYDYNVIYGNNGNGDDDKMLIGITSGKLDDLETAGFSISTILKDIEIKSGETATVKWEIRAPEGLTTEESYEIEFYVTSDFSCRSEGLCNTQNMILTVRVTPEPDAGGIVSIADNSTMTYSAVGGGVLAAAVAIVIFMKRKKSATFEQDVYEDEYEEELVDDFDEDFEDDFFEGL